MNKTLSMLFFIVGVLLALTAMVCGIYWGQGAGG